MCKEKGIEPYKDFSGRFNVRMNPDLHAAAVHAAAARGKSLNDFVVDAVTQHTQS